jgi:serine/threonine-protein kinase
LPGVPPAVAEVVDRALAFDKSARWSSADAMRAALRSAFVGTYHAELSATPLGRLVEAAPDPALARTQPSEPRPLSQEPSPVDAISGPATVDAQAWPGAPLAKGATERSTLGATEVRREPPANRPRRARIAIVLAALLLVLALGAGAFAVRSPSAPSAPASADVTRSIDAPSVSAVVSGTARPESSVPEISVADLPLAPAIKPPPKAGPPPRGVAPAPPPQATTTAPAKATSCSPPYEIDANGHKLWKKECL